MPQNPNLGHVFWHFFQTTKIQNFINPYYILLEKEPRLWKGPTVGRIPRSLARVGRRL